MKIRCYQQKNDYFIHEIFYTKLMITMKHKSRAETQNIKKRKQKKKMEIQTNQKTKDKKTKSSFIYNHPKGK